MARRDLLHKTKLKEFRDWLERNGLSVLPPVGDYEVLRWKGVAGHPMPIVFDRHEGTGHYTCNRSAERYVQNWLWQRKRENACAE